MYSTFRYRNRLKLVIERGSRGRYMNIENKKSYTRTSLIIGGGTAGCYAALTIREKSDYSIIIAEKANIKRSGCLTAGVNAINAYIVKGQKA